MVTLNLSFINYNKLSIGGYNPDNCYILSIHNEKSTFLKISCRHFETVYIYDNNWHYK